MTPAHTAAALVSANLASRLTELAAGLTTAECWPGQQFDLLRDCGVLGWTIPEEFGGHPASPAELLSGYCALARACLTTTFVLTQRNGACQRIAQSPNVALKHELLPKLAHGELFATVGISHLTTSRQHQGAPAVQATMVGESVELTGEVPWVTGAAHAQLIVTGGAFADGRQILVAIPTDAPGVAISAPACLLALSASQTSPVLLERVRLDPRWIVQTPAQNVMQQGPNVSTGSLSTSALALGLAWAALDAIEGEAQRRPPLIPIAQSLRHELKQLEHDLLAQATPDGCGPAAGANESLRTRANSLVLRSTQALMAASKGAGFVSGHFAERAAREALFFLVWSCPQPVVSANLREFAGLPQRDGPAA
ncbi:MAG: acyl-CoA dehydrogenase [Planctomycetaceae bacterium]|nr:MAG: acyl-CoA dehydrogenase [Planctomycetaceae bacterium]